MDGLGHDLTIEIQEARFIQTTTPKFVTLFLRSRVLFIPNQGLPYIFNKNNKLDSDWHQRLYSRTWHYWGELL